MLRVIREIRPSWIVGENVPGIIGMELENICLAMESEGYEVQPFVIPSAGIGAWDKRERVWIIAYNNKFRCDNEQKGQIKTLQNTIGIIETKKQGRRQQQCGVSESNIITSNSDGQGLENRHRKQIQQRPIQRERTSTGQAHLNDRRWRENWIEVASELCRSNARVSHRLDRIKGLGNSVNPYVPYQIFKAIQQYEDNLNVEPKTK